MHLWLVSIWKLHTWPQLSKAKRTVPRHLKLNNTIHRALTSARQSLEPVGFSRDDGERPDGVTLSPWSKGKRLAASYLNATSKNAGAAA